MLNFCNPYKFNYPKNFFLFVIAVANIIAFSVFSRKFKKKLKKISYPSHNQIYYVYKEIPQLQFFFLFLYY